MIALVCEKKKFESDKGDVYYTLLLSILSEKDNNFHVITVKDKNGSYVSYKHFVPPEVYDSVVPAHVYEFQFDTDQSSGRSRICNSKPYKA